MTAPDRGATTSNHPCVEGAVHTWLGRFGHADKWISCLTAATVPRIRSDDDETSTSDAQPQLRYCRKFRVWGRTMPLKEPSYAAPQTACDPG